MLLVALLWPVADLQAETAASPESQVKMRGEWTQGAVILGQAPPGTEITLNDKKIPISADGHFVLGFARKAKLKWTLDFTYPEGGGWTYSIALKARKYRVRQIRNVGKRVAAPDPEDLARIKKNRQAIRAARGLFSDDALFADGFIWPVRGRISGPYGSQRMFDGKARRPHFGIDIAAETGTPVIAPADGIVVLALENAVYSGNMIILDHGLGLSSSYAHMSALKVDQGQRVKRGEVIGLVGNTGRSSGPHLHWSLNWRRIALDPATVLPPMGHAKNK